MPVTLDSLTDPEFKLSSLEERTHNIEDKLRKALQSENIDIAIDDEIQAKAKIFITKNSHVEQ